MPQFIHLIAASVHDLQAADVLLKHLKAPFLLADKAYDAKERVIDKLVALKCKPVIPSKTNAKEQRVYDKQLYKKRHLIENFFAKLKQYRAIATRYDKLARNFLAGIHIVASLIWLK